MIQQKSAATPAKLTSWANEPTLQQLKLDLQSAKPSHDAQVSKIGKWNELLKVEGRAKPKPVKGRSSVQPKMIRRQAEWRYSALTEPFLGSNKLFTVSPTTFEDGEAARQNELVLNYQFRSKLNRVNFIDNFVRATVDEGTSIIQVGWERKTTKAKEAVPVYTYYAPQSQEQLDALQQALELKQVDPRGYNEKIPPELQAAVDFYEETGQASVAQQTGEEVTEVEKIVLNHPTAVVLDPANVVIDPSCNGDLDKALFVMVSFETNKASLLAQGKRYQNLDMVNWEGAAPINEPDHATNTPTDFQFADKLRKKVVAVEYWGFWDIHNNGTLEPIVATWIGDVLIRMELNPFPDGKLPFILVPYLPVKRELYGEPDAELLEDNQRILGALIRGMIDLLGKSANAQQGFAKGLLDPLNRRRYDNGQDYEFNPNLSPQQGLITHTYPELPNSALMMLNLQNQEAEALTGVKSFAGGVSGDAYGDVAAGIRGALDAASKREMAILRRLAKGINDLGQKIIAMNAVFLSEEEVIRITNQEFVTVKREDLKGQFDLEVDISTAEVDNAKAQDLAFMLQTLGNTVDQSLTLKILAEICRLKRMPELAEELKNFKPQPDPMVQQMKELELEHKKAEIAEMQSRAALNQAKARQAQADAGKIELDVIEQGTGTQHARNKDLQQSQAQGNKELQVTKALTAPRKDGEKSPDIEAAIGYNQLSDGAPSLSRSSMPLSVDNLPQNSDLASMEPGFPSAQPEQFAPMVPEQNPELSF